MKERDFRQTNKQSEESNILREQIKEKAAENSLEEIKRAQERAASNRTRVAEFHTLFKVNLVYNYLITFINIYSGVGAWRETESY